MFERFLEVHEDSSGAIALRDGRFRTQALRPYGIDDLPTPHVGVIGAVHTGPPLLHHSLPGGLPYLDQAVDEPNGAAVPTGL